MGAGAEKRAMMDETTERQELEAQLQAAMAAMRATVLRLLQEGEVHPQLVVLAAAATAGELAASVALADGRVDGPAPVCLGQATEVAIAVRALNHMLELGRPQSVRVA